MDDGKVNGFDLSAFDGLLTQQEEGVAVEIIHPATGEPLGLTITVAGPDSTRAKTAERAMINRRLKAQKTKPMTADELQAEGLRKLAACAISWDGMVSDGKPLECNVENAMLAFERAPWIAEQVAEAAGNRAAFFTS